MIAPLIVIVAVIVAGFFAYVVRLIWQDSYDEWATPRFGPRHARTDVPALAPATPDRDALDALIARAGTSLTALALTEPEPDQVRPRRRVNPWDPRENPVYHYAWEARHHQDIWRDQSWAAAAAGDFPAEREPFTDWLRDSFVNGMRALTPADLGEEIPA